MYSKPPAAWTASVANTTSDTQGIPEPYSLASFEAHNSSTATRRPLPGRSLPSCIRQKMHIGPATTSSLAHHHDRAAGVADHRMRDAAHQRAPQGPEATAAYHYKARAKLLGQPHDLCIGPPEPRVRLRYLAAVLPYPPDLLVEPRLSLFPGALLHPA